MRKHEHKWHTEYGQYAGRLHSSTWCIICKQTEFAINRDRDKEFDEKQRRAKESP